MVFVFCSRWTAFCCPGAAFCSRVPVKNPKSPVLNLMCADVRQVDSPQLTMNKNENGNTAPAPSPVALVRNTRPVSAKARELLNDQSNGLPVWIRPPKQGVEFYSGLSRAKLYELAAAGKIVSRSLRDPGQIKATRLFLLSSVLDYIASCSDGRPETETAPASKEAAP